MEQKFLKNYLRILIGITFILISLGGAVRAMNAGLACPDWPLCFYKVIPDFDPQVYYEFIHRAIAGIVAVMTLVLNFIILRGSFSKSAKRTILFADFILISQIIMGGLTVLKLLHFSVVTAHLGLGISFLCVLLWLYFLLFTEEREYLRAPKSFHGVLIFIAVVLFIQILLGGLVSSNYAGLACEGFPLCNGELIPTLEGFVGLQVKHRFWGYLTAICIFSFTHMIWRNRKQPWISPQILKLGYLLSVLILMQIGVGAVNVLFKIPPVVTVVHLGLAALLMGIMLRILFLGTQNKNENT